MVVAASWLTSGWIDVAMIVGWMALVIAIGLVVWVRGGSEAAAPPPVQAPPGPLPRLLGLALIAFAVVPWARRRSAR